MITIEEALHRFLLAERERVPESTEETEFVLQNLVSFLEGYGYQYIGDGEPDEDFGLDDSMGEIDETEAHVVGSNGPDVIPASLGDFLYYWYVRKFMGDADDARATGLVSARLMEWLSEQGLADADEAREAAVLARAASEELPRALRLAELLDDMARGSSAAVGLATSDAGQEPHAVIDDFVPIVRIAPGRLWFAQVGPIEVPREASDLAELGWEVNLVASKRAGTWAIEEVGTVYPRSVRHLGADREAHVD